MGRPSAPGACSPVRALRAGLLIRCPLDGGTHLPRPRHVRHRLRRGGGRTPQLANAAPAPAGDPDRGGHECDEDASAGPGHGARPGKHQFTCPPRCHRADPTASADAGASAPDRWTSARAVSRIRQLVVRGRAHGHVGGPRGRPGSGRRPEAVPGPPCRWARGRGGHGGDALVVAPWGRGGRRVLGRAQGGGVSGPPRSRGEKQRGSIPIAADPRRRSPARGAAPLRLGWVCPCPSSGCLHRSGTDRRGRAVLVRTDDRPERRLHPLAADPSGAAHDGRSTGTRRRWSRSVSRSARVPAAASSRADALEPAPLPRSAFCARAHGVLSARLRSNALR